MKNNKIIMLFLASMLFIPSFTVNVSADEILENVDTKAVQDEHYNLPYTFEEFLAFTDEEFLLLPDIPNNVKEDFVQLRAYNKLSHTIALRFYDDENIPETEEEICEILGIPYTVVYDISKGTAIKGFPFIINFNEENYKRHPINDVANKIMIYLKYNPLVADISVSYKSYSESIKNGDVNVDGTIDIIDVLALNQYLLGIYKPSDAGIDAADVNYDGVVDDADAMKILKSLVGLETLE